MKTDREFLDGVYAKAKLIEENPPKTQKTIHFTPLKRTFAAAAAFIVVAASSLLYFNQPKMEVPASYQASAPMAIRAFGVAELNLENLANNAKLIVTGKVTQIKKSVYDEEKSSIITSVTVKPTQLLKGETAAKQLDIAVTGGYHKQTDTFIDYEAIFERSEDVLVFLTWDEPSQSYVLSGGSQGKYSYLNAENEVKRYIGKDDATIIISQLEEIIAKGEK